MNNPTNIGWPKPYPDVVRDWPKKNIIADPSKNWPKRYQENIVSPINNIAATQVVNKIFNSLYGYGLVNAAASLSQIIGTNVPDVVNLGGTKWFADMVKAPEVWAKGYLGDGIIVAVVDTGIDYNHQDFQGQIWQNIDEIANNAIDDDNNGYIDDVIGWDFVQSDNTPMDANSHGTHVAGIIDQIAPNVKLMAVRIADATGFAGLSNFAKGIYYAANNGANVINISMGGSAPTNTIRTAITYATNKGCIVAMAAGNSGGSAPIYPAIYASEVGLSVGAVNSTRTMATFSNKAGPNPLDYVVAPGVNINAAIPGNRYGNKSGTSMATPVVAGVAALLLSANTNLTPSQIEDLITSNAVPL